MPFKTWSGGESKHSPPNPFLLLANAVVTAPVPKHFSHKFSPKLAPSSQSHHGKQHTEVEAHEDCGTSSSVPVADGRLRGEWLLLVVTVQSLTGYVTDGILPADGWNIPSPDEQGPAPRDDERVVLT